MKLIQNHKWLIVVGAVIVQLSIGTIYSWSLFNYPLMEQFGWSEKQVVLTFSIATFMFAFSTMISGRLLDKYGPRLVATLGGILYGSGLLLASTSSSVYELYFYYGVLSGMGVGFVYVCPISTSVKWFPNKKGLITGVAVGAFGLGSFVFKFVIQTVLNHNSILRTFSILGIVYMFLIILGAQFLLNPKYKTTTLEGQLESKIKKDYNINQMIHKPIFYLSWTAFFLGCMSGLLVIGLALDLGVYMAGLTIEQAANTVVLIAFFNALGRIIFGSLSDKLGRFQVILMMFIMTGISMLLLGIAPLNFITFFVIIAAVAFCFGGFLSVYPIITEELFGKKNFGSNYGIMYQAYGFAAISGSVLLNLVSNFQVIFILLSILAFIGFVIVLYILKNKRRLLS